MYSTGRYSLFGAKLHVVKRTKRSGEHVLWPKYNANDAKIACEIQYNVGSIVWQDLQMNARKIDHT